MAALVFFMPLLTMWCWYSSTERQGLFSLPLSMCGPVTMAQGTLCGFWSWVIIGILTAPWSFWDAHPWSPATCKSMSMYSNQSPVEVPADSQHPLAHRWAKSLQMMQPPAFPRLLSCLRVQRWAVPYWALPKYIFMSQKYCCLNTQTFGIICYTARDNWNIIYIDCMSPLLTFNIMSVWFFHVVACSCILFIFIALEYMIAWTTYNLHVHCTVDRH